MSMLADRKIKQKWSLNPRGKAWSEDSNKFGQKLLEKMGWSHGKGLGAKENGIVEHVKVSYKNDSKGMGYKESDDQWTEHDSNFNALLQSLSGQEPKTEVKLASLEKKSEKSKVRVHYKKFTRGKDLSRCSEKDLANIFGKKSLKEAPPVVEEPEDTKESSDDGFSHNRGSMVDYFKRKIPNFGKINGYALGNNGVLKKDTDSEEESYVGFGFKRKFDEESSNRTPKKVRRDDEDHVGLSNPAFDPLFGKVEVQKHVLNTIKEEDVSLGQEIQEEGKNEETQHDSYINEDFEVKGKKKKKSKDDASPTINNSNGNEHLEVKRKKKKKSKENIALDNPNFEDGDCQDSYINEDFELPRKKKKNKDNPNFVNIEIVTSATDNPNFEDNDCQDSYVREDCEVKRKKKKENKENGECQNSFEVKRKTKRVLAIDNPNYEDNDNQDSYVNEDFEVPRKKRKKNKEKTAMDNPSFQTDDCQDSYVNEDFEVKRKNKKKKKTDDNLAIDNPNFISLNSEASNKSEEIEETKTDMNFDLMLNVTSTPSAPKEISKSSIKRRKSVRFSSVTEERIIPNNDMIEDGTSNLEEISKRIDGFQAEIENDINEAKDIKYIGEVGNPDGDNEKLPEGTKLKFKYAKFGKAPIWVKKSPASKSKSSYKHLIKGDIVLGFNNTNLHEIQGYGVKNNSQ